MDSAIQMIILINDSYQSVERHSMRSFRLHNSYINRQDFATIRIEDVAYEKPTLFSAVLFDILRASIKTGQHTVIIIYLFSKP